MSRIIPARGPYPTGTYEDAEFYCMMFEQDGYRNWRMPSQADRIAIFNDTPFDYKSLGDYWLREDCVTPYLTLPIVPVRTDNG